MATRKKTQSPHPEELKIEIAPSVPRKRNPPSTAFKPGNTHRIKRGQVLNPYGRSGKPKEDNRLLSKSLKAQLNTRAPDAVATAVGLEKYASWAQCLAASLLLRSVLKGDTAAANLILTATEGSNARLEIEHAMRGIPQTIEVVFVESDGDGRPRQIDIESGFYQPPAALPAPPIEALRAGEGETLYPGRIRPSRAPKQAPKRSQNRS